MRKAINAALEKDHRVCGHPGSPRRVPIYIRGHNIFLRILTMDKLRNMIPARPGFYELFVNKRGQDRRYSGWHVEAWGLLHNDDDHVPPSTEDWVRPMLFVKEFESLDPTECTRSESLGIFYLGL